MRRSIWAGFFVSIVLHFFFTSTAQAISMSSVIDFMVQQGEVQEKEILVENSNTNTATIEFSLMHMSFGEDELPQIGGRAEDVSWITISSKVLSLAPGERSTLSIAVSPSEDLPSGSYAFGILGIELEDGVFTFQHGVTTLIFVTVGDPTVYEECLEFFRQNDGNFRVRLRNVGQGILYEEGSVVLRGPLNIVFGSAEGNPSFRRIFSQQTRSWITESLSVPWWGFGPMEYTFESSLSSFPCLPIPAGFGYQPFVLFLVIVTGLFVWRRR